MRRLNTSTWDDVSEEEIPRGRGPMNSSSSPTRGRPNNISGSSFPTSGGSRGNSGSYVPPAAQDETRLQGLDEVRVNLDRGKFLDKMAEDEKTKNKSVREIMEARE